MDASHWLIGLSRRLRLAALALLLAFGVKTVAVALAPVERPSASVQIEMRSINATQGESSLVPG